MSIRIAILWILGYGVFVYVFYSFPQLPLPIKEFGALIFSPLEQFAMNGPEPLVWPLRMYIQLCAACAGVAIEY
jgi:hypothetical protein